MEESGEAAVQALTNLQRNMERSGKKLSKANVTRPVANLYTPEARATYLQAMLSAGATAEDVRLAAERAAFEQWIGFLWRDENDRFAPEIRMSPCPRDACQTTTQPM